MTENNGGPAFPRIYPRGIEDTTTGGMTLRDWFAGMALQGILSEGFMQYGQDPEIANASYRYADNMLKARGEA